MDLPVYLTKLQQLDQIESVATEVSCDLELAALCRREFAKPDGGKALLFKQLKGSKLPVVANLFGSELRAAQMLHSRSFVEIEGKVKRWMQAGQGTAEQRLNSNVAARKRVDSLHTNLQQADHPDAQSLPAIRSWSGETGRYLTLALTVTQHPDTGQCNLGLYRAQILGEDRIALNFAPGSGAAQHLQVVAERNEVLPVALFLGSDPALLWSAAAPLPASCDEFTFTTALFNRSFSFTQCHSQNLQVPADAEIVIEGQIDPRQTCVEGPFGNHTGSYVTRQDCPVLQVTGIQQKPQAVMPLTVVGPPPSENIFLAQANQILIREMLKIDYPQILDLQMPIETIFHATSLLKVRSLNQKDNRELIDNLWKSSPLRRAKIIILLDEDIELKSFAHCWWRTINQFDSGKLYQDSGRIAIDATGVDPASLVKEDQQTIDLLKQRRSEYKL